MYSQYSNKMNNPKLLVLFSLLVIAQCATIPDYIHVCNRNDPNLVQCIINSITSLLPKLRVGIPELNVPPIEPLKLPDTTLKSSGGATQLNVNLTNILVSGASEFNILELKAKINKDYFRVKAIYPKIYLESDYSIDSKILVLALQGSGKLQINITDFSYDCILRGNIVNENGGRHLKFEKLKFKIGFGSGQVWLENLFNGDPILGKATNEAINENFSLFFDELRPVFENTLSNVFTDVANGIMETFEYDDLFPNKS